MATGIGYQLPLDNHLFMPQMTVQAMRDSRYRHPANAIAELIDNSIDARARRVDLLIREEEKTINTRRRWRISQIAVIDNGHGMSSETLVQALRFGGHQKSQTVNRIGKYGMGLPTSSVSQCRRVDVWTWQKDIEQAVHSYIDLEEVEKGELIFVPDPKPTEIPSQWTDMVSEQTLNKARGTLVVWSDTDRITVQAQTIFNQVEEEIGRIYRHYINEKDLTIRMASMREGDQEPHTERMVRPNDPLYLMKDSATPSPWDQEPMFEENSGKIIPMQIGGREELIELRFSIAKRQVLGEHKGDLPGNRPHGRHALKNLGISVVRENREILMENFFSRRGGGNSIPQNRWWGCEIRFGQGADSLFGIDHNKQMVANLSRAFKDLYEGMSDNEIGGAEAVIDDLGFDDDIYKMASYVRGTVNSMMEEIHLRFEQRPSKSTNTEEKSDDGPKDPEGEAIDLITQVARESIEVDDEPLTESDVQRNTMEEEERVSALTDSLVESEGYTKEQAEEKAKAIILRDDWFTISPSQLDGYRIFSVKGAGGVLNVRLNINNHIYELIKLVDREAGNNENTVARSAAIAIRAMILSWARMEDGTENWERKMELQEMSEKWGKSVHRILANLEIENPITDED